jgi:hypothetical protein
MNSLIIKFNRLNLSFLFFIIACANYLGFQLYGGEEQYFAFAKQLINPSWVPGSFTLTHPAGGNLFFEIIAGYTLNFLSFEQLAFWGRMINFLLLAMPLSLIFKHFKISNIEAVFIFQLFFLPHQSLFAGEWIFQNFEVKTIAYIFVFYSIYYLLKDKLFLCVVFAVPATLFHFLAGGWFFIIAIAFFLIKGENIRRILISLGIYVIALAPFLFYLAKLYFIDNPSVINGVNTNWIYCYERLPFHLGIFKSYDYFMKTHFDGVLISLILFVLCIFWFRRFKNPLLQKLNLLNIILFSEQFLFIIIALFDKNGFLLKTYPFRTSTLSSLFIMLEIALILKYYASEPVYKLYLKIPRIVRQKDDSTRRMVFSNSINTFLLLFFLLFLSIEINETLHGKNTDQPPVDKEMKCLIQYIKENTNKEDVFLFFEPGGPISFTRLAERENFIVWKFTPTKSEAIYEIYQRKQLLSQLRGDITRINTLANKYKVDYLVTSVKTTYPSLIPVKSFGELTLYKLKR